MKSSSKKRGISLIEVVVACSVILIATVSTLAAYGVYTRYALDHDRGVQAAYLGEEALEAVGLMRDASWTGNIVTMQNNTPYYLTWVSGRWATTTTETYVDGVFLRSLTFYPVYRDASKHISESGTLDTSSRKVTAGISYREAGATTTVSVSTYITDLYSN